MQTLHATLGAFLYFNRENPLASLEQVVNLGTTPPGLAMPVGHRPQRPGLLPGDEFLTHKLLGDRPTVHG